VESLIAQILEEHDRLDFAFNNAGIEGALAPTAEYATEDWNRVLGVNLTGVWLCMRAEIRAMLRRGAGVIVNNASILGHVAFANAGAYTASKHGVLGLTKAAALEYATQGIRVNAVCPGIIETQMVMERGVKAGENQDTYRQLAELHPMNRMGTPEEIASAVLWLCSDGASFVTGQSLLVDGGYTVR
jgi:NAD(P)-dependent dehydrogenase (short-subunit alcohol dehydrogenase family)